MPVDEMPSGPRDGATDGDLLAIEPDLVGPIQDAELRPSRMLRIVRLAAIDTGPLRRHRDFRLLFSGRTSAFFGAMVRSVALPYQVFTLTHSSLAVGLIGLIQIIPILLLAFLGGALADARDRRQMVLATEIGLACCSSLLLVNALVPSPQLWLVYAVAATGAGLDALQRPSLEALLPRVVERHELTAAAALNSFGASAGMVTGPALGGVLIAAVGLPATYGVDVAMFLVSLTALSAMRAMPPPPDAERPSLRRIAEGLRYARSRPELMGTYIVDMVAMFFGMPMALFPALAAGYGGPGVLGLLYAAPAVGDLVASVFSGWSKHVHRHGLAITLAAAVWGAAVIGFGFSRSLPLALLCLGIAGAADMISGIFRSTVWNQTIPDALRGRLAGIELVSYASGPTLGDFEAGSVAAVFGVRASVISGGFLCVIGVGLVALALPTFIRYDARRYAQEQHLAGAATPLLSE
jgi:MFS family permease